MQQIVSQAHRNNSFAPHSYTAAPARSSAATASLSQVADSHAVVCCMQGAYDIELAANLTHLFSNACFRLILPAISGRFSATEMPLPAPPSDITSPPE